MTGNKARPRIDLAIGLFLVVTGITMLGMNTAPSDQQLAADRRATVSQPANGASSPARSAERAPATCKPAMILRIPSLALEAPVLEGADRPTLARGVGHVPRSDLPGQGTTTVLAAHNNSYFHALDHLRPGDRIQFTDGCHTWDYEVAGGQVVSAGDPVLRAAEPTLVLVTCWPLDALTRTPYRYLVTAHLRPDNRHAARDGWE